MGCKYSVSASANQNTVTVTGHFQNNGYTYSGSNETFWTECNGSRQYMYRTIPQGASFSWTHSYNVGNSTSVRTYSVSAGGPSWSNFDNSSASTTVSVPATPPSVTTPPVVTNQKAVLSGSTVTISWTNNGSGTSNPTGNYVDVRVDDGDWENILKTKATSTTYSVSANHKYEFRVNSYNSAGQSTHQSTNTIYTSPATPTVVNPVGVIFPSAGSFNFTCDKTDTLYPSEEIEWQYSTDSGSSWSTIQTASGNVISVSSSDSSLNSFIMGLKNNNNCYVRARIYNYDNSIVSDWSVAAHIKVTLQPICLVNVPDGATIKAVYINMPNNWVNKASEQAYLSDVSVTNEVLIANKATVSNEVLNIE